MNRAERGSHAQHASSRPHVETSSLQYARRDDRQDGAAPMEDSNQLRCNICSYSQTFPMEPAPVFHKHFSSAQLREILEVEGTGRWFYCPSCKSRHRPYIDERIKVVVSDSTLHEFFAPSSHSLGMYEGDLIHVDYVTIANGTIAELLHAFKLDYIVKRRPKLLDVVLVAGYADVVKGHSREFILWGISTFADMVLMENGRRTGNTFTVASLMYPPRLCWFSDNGPIPYRYTNHLEKFDWLNAQIHALNAHNNSSSYPGLHSYGTRKSVMTVTDTDGNSQLRHSRTHRWEHWAESARRDKFTLRADRKFKMGKAVNIFFLYRT